MLSLLVTSVLATKIWEMDSPKTYKIALPKGLITTEQLQDQLHKTDCNSFVDKQKPKAPASDKCWHFNRPKSCPNKGYIKYDDVHFVHATVGAAAANAVVTEKGKTAVGLVVGNITMAIPKTKFTVQPKGLITFPCDGVVGGIVKGAAAAVQAVIDMAADGVPVLGQISAQPLDGVVVELQHALTGVCGFLEAILKGLLQLVISDLQDIVNVILPDITKLLLGDLVQGGMGAKLLNME